MSNSNASIKVLIIKNVAVTLGELLQTLAVLLRFAVDNQTDFLGNKRVLESLPVTQET